ncbi:MAG: hypothetical protein ACYDCN_12295 [Bacteroidia bacterium]
MKKLIITSLIIAGFVFSSCKKSSPAPTSTHSTTTPYCFLTAVRSFSYSSGSLVLNTNTADAEFRSDINNISTDMQIGSVSVGGKGLKYLSGSKSYQDTTNLLSIIPTNWQVVGAGPIPSCTYTNNDSLPIYTGYTSLPDTIFKSQNLNLQINGISGADAIEVSFYNPTVPSSNIYQMKSTGVVINNTISFTSSTLSPLPLSSSSGSTLLAINVFKYNYQVISGVTFSFETQLEINKQVYIK